MKLFDVRKGELAQVSLSALWFFLVLACYYVVRPVRDTFATNLSSDEKATLFTATLVVMVLITPLYGLIVARTPRGLLVPFVYGFFTMNLLLFAAVTPSAPDWLGKVFFVWVSVFNLFIVTLFWGTVVDCFTGEQGKRLFGIIAAAGTVGQIASSWLVQLAVEQLSTSGLLVCSAALLISAMGCSLALSRHTEPSEALDTSRFRWSAAWEGAVSIARSPLLLGIALFIIGSSVCATFAYFQMTDMLRVEFASQDERSAWLANVNEWTGYVTLILQSSVVSVLLRKLGVAATLSIAPLVLVAGFLAMHFSATLGIMFLFQVALRGTSFGFANPSLETLYTRVSREEKYRAKAFIDTVGKRTGDVAGGQLSSYFAQGTMGVAGIVIGIAAFVVALLLGVRYGKPVESRTEPS
ncbi:MAG: hypothetical protein RID07_10870 [Lacipirellulaceae bacterium]